MTKPIEIKGNYYNETALYDVLVNLYNSMCGGCKLASLCHHGTRMNLNNMSQCVTSTKVVPEIGCNSHN